MNQHKNGESKMKSPFTLSDENLRTLLKGYSDWCESDEKEKGYINDQKLKTEDLKATLLSEEYLSKVSDDELAKKVFVYSRTLEGPAYIKLGTPRISGELHNVKRNLQYLMQSSDDPFKKASRILEGDYKVPVFAKAFWSPLLQAQYTTVLPNWNNKTERFLRKVGINLQTSKLTIEEKYKLLSDAFLYIQSLDPSQSFYSINHLMHYGTEVEAGIGLINELLGEGKTPVSPPPVKHPPVTPGLDPQMPYSLSDCAEETGFSVELLARWVRAIERKGQAIIYGPPGTGKTYIAERLARHLVSGGDGFADLIQFHPSYAYEDFIQGIRPKARQDGGLDYPLVHGRFFEFCQKAQSCKSLCVLIIDEINRANLARVLGELMYLLEYRDREIPLSSGGSFRIPPNVRIVGTMNTADRSIALVDHALRRRFAFLALYPNFDLLRWYHKETGFPAEGLVQTLLQLNNQIGDPHYEIGVTFFLHKDIAGKIEDIWRMEIEPYLEEYFFDQREKVDQFRWEKIQAKILS